MAMVRDSGMGDSGYGLEPGFPIVGLNRHLGPPNLTVPKNLHLIGLKNGVGRAGREFAGRIYFAIPSR